jgi:hypothetical protein
MGLLTVTSGSTSVDLITIQDLPMALRGSNSSNDFHLSKLITRISEAIPRWLGCHLAEQTYREDVPGFGTTTLQIMQTATNVGLLPSGPITSVQSVFLLNTENSTVSATESTNFYVQDRMAGQLFKQDGWDKTSQRALNLVSREVPDTHRPLWRVNYTAGFTLPRVGIPTQTQAGTLPQDIRQAAIESVSLVFHRERRDTSVVRRKIGDVELQYGTQSGALAGASMTGLAPSSEALLQPWKRIPWGG